MKQASRTLLLLVLALVIAAPLSAADDKKKKKKGKKPDAAAAILKRLEKAELSEEQVSKIKALVAEHSSKIADARKKAALTKEQAAARKEAAAKIKADGKKGKEAREALNAAVSLTEDQKAGLAEARKLRSELQKAVFGLLSDDQKAKVGAKTRKKKKADK